MLVDHLVPDLSLGVKVKSPSSALEMFQAAAQVGGQALTEWKMKLCRIAP